MKQCVYFRTDDGCRWCELGFMVKCKNGICVNKCRESVNTKDKKL